MPRSHLERMRRRTGPSEPPETEIVRPEHVGSLDEPFASERAPSSGGTQPPSDAPKGDPEADYAAIRRQRAFGMAFGIDLLEAPTLECCREGVQRARELGIPLSDMHALSVLFRTAADALQAACIEAEHGAGQ